MQTAETFTAQTFFKLLLLFVLLITGVMFKTPDAVPVVEAKNLKVSPPALASEPDSSRQIQRFYFRVTSSGATSAAL